jgi:hypothetical protein
MVFGGLLTREHLLCKDLMKGEKPCHIGVTALGHEPEKATGAASPPEIPKVAHGGIHIP